MPVEGIGTDDLDAGKFGICTIKAGELPAEPLTGKLDWSALITRLLPERLLGKRQHGLMPDCPTVADIVPGLIQHVMHLPHR